MAFYFLLHAVESSILQSGRPSADAIFNALQTVQLPSGARWITAVARITRRNEASFKPWKTDVDWVLEVPAPYSSQEATRIAQDAASRMDAALQRVSSDWSRTSVESYDAGREGPVSSWNATPRADHRGIEAAEELQRQAAQAATDATDFLNRVGQGIGGILGNTTASTLKPLESLGGALIAAAIIAVLGVAAVRFLPARRNPVVKAVLK